MAFRGVGKTTSNIFNRTLSRLFGAGLKKGAQSPLDTSGKARWVVRNNQTDWRVKLTLPPKSDLQAEFFNDDNKVMAPLAPFGGMVFPLTPSVIVQHSAAYNPMAVTHSNYPFYAYQNSESSSLTIVGEFPVQNYQDAQAWVATMHFLRTVTKMFFGGTDEKRGNPPPVLYLNGYGEHVFNNVPVVVTTFNCELTQGVDYISTLQNRTDVSSIKQSEIEYIGNERTDVVTPSADNVPVGWAPTSSNFTIQIQPVYSRDAVKEFSLDKFAKGQLTGGKNGIGYI